MPKKYNHKCATCSKNNVPQYSQFTSCKICRRNNAELGIKPEKVESKNVHFIALSLTVKEKKATDTYLRSVEMKLKKNIKKVDKFEFMGDLIV